MSDRASGPTPDESLALGAIAFLQTRDPLRLVAVEREVVAAGGRTLQQLDDLLKVWFDSASDCIQALEKLSAWELRAGASVGDVSTENDLLNGLPVIEASRLKDLADIGDVLCTVRLLRLAGASRNGWKDEGEVALKGIDRPVHIARRV